MAEQVPRDDPDRGLLRAMAQGDVHALDELYARHGGRILSYLMNMVGDRLLAEEVLQDVMLAAWRGAAHFRGDSRVRTWLMSIARLQALGTLRGRRLVNVPLDESIMAEEIRDSTTADRQFDSMTIRAALKQLPADQRETLELIFYHELSGVEAAQMLGVAPGTIKSRLSRAKSTLRGLLQRKEAE